MPPLPNARLHIADHTTNKSTITVLKAQRQRYQSSLASRSQAVWIDLLMCGQNHQLKKTKNHGTDHWHFFHSCVDVMVEKLLLLPDSSMES